MSTHNTVEKRTVRRVYQKGQKKENLKESQKCFERIRSKTWAGLAGRRGHPRVFTDPAGRGY